jgi:predicted outer membrane lipoprotein
VAPPKPDMMIFYFCQALLQILLSGAFRIGNSSVLSYEQMEKKKKNDMNLD